MCAATTPVGPLPDQPPPPLTDHNTVNTPKIAVELSTQAELLSPRTEDDATIQVFEN